MRSTGGELGIRTPDSLVGNTRLAGEHLRPLGQLSVAVTYITARTPENTSTDYEVSRSMAKVGVTGQQSHLKDAALAARRGAQYPIIRTACHMRPL